MRIHTMTATFGKLEHETLHLEPGLNILERPNEWGKSTWCAFLVAMLYGIETRTHTTKTALADKERYAPWSASPMAGQMEITWQGREITLQRRTRGRIPMGEFSAFETHTGLPVPELTGENCGQLLLGVEKPVFLRSAFLRGSDLTVEPEESLRRRLHALVTTGEETSTADDLEKKLRELKNRIHANRTTGLLPQAYQRRSLLQRDLETLDSLKRQCGQMEQQLQSLGTRREALELHRQAMDYQAGLEAGQKYAQANQELKKAMQEEAQCREAVRALPEKQILEQRQQQLTRLLSQEMGAALEGHPASGEARKFRRLRLAGTLLLLLAALLWAAGAWHGVLEGIWPAWAMAGAGILCAALGAGFLLWAGGLKRAHHNRPPEVWALEEAVRCITRGETPEAYLLRLQEGLALHRKLEAAVQGRKRAEAAAAALKGEPEILQPPARKDTLSCSRQETGQLLGQISDQVRQLQLRLGACRGQMTALGDEKDLQGAMDAENRRIQELEETFAATKIALDALAEARTELQRRFAPQIVKKTQSLFGSLTGGRYDQLAMEENLQLQVRAQGEDTARPSLWRSEGTVDQLYLALRLAVASELVPTAPLILDDALVRFDDQRLALAMELLQKEAENRQILLFTCQSRENRWITGGTP